MSDALEKLKKILKEKLPDTEAEALIAELTVASGNGSVAIGEDASDAVIATGNQNMLGDNNRFVIHQGTSADELIKLLSYLLKEIRAANSTFESGHSPQSRTQLTSETVLHQFPEAFRFDLSQLIEKCLEELDGRSGLVGLVVPCGEDAFLRNFCDRLKFELGRSLTKVRRTQSLSPQVISVSKAVDAIKQYKDQLQNNHVICPLRIKIADPSSNIPKDFWQQLQDAFQEKYQYHLIVVMVGTENCVFPPDVILLPPPQFRRVHARQWVREMTELLNWMPIFETWLQKMVACCLYDEQQPELLDVGLVYDHLEDTLTLLKKEQPLTAEAFLEQLD